MDDTKQTTKSNEIDPNKVARKPFKVEIASAGDRELAVFTHAKKLSEYIFVITEKSPKKLRWSIVSRLQNCSVQIIEDLYRANFERAQSRLEFQKKAAVNLTLLNFFADAAKKMQAINMHQLSVIALNIEETRKLLMGWARSTKKQMEETASQR